MADAAYAREWRIAHPEQYRAISSRRIAKVRQVKQDAKARPCADCGVQYPPWVMQFDHIPGRGDKEFTIGERPYGYDAIRAEIEKCEVVCANCHAERTHQRKAAVPSS